MSNQEDDMPVDDKELEDFYRNDGVHSARRQIRRQSSRASATSIGSTASGQSSSSVGESREMGIQTTIGRSNGASHLAHIDESAVTNGGSQTDDTRHKRRSSTKDKMKKLFRRKSSQDSNGNQAPAEVATVLPQGFIVKYMGKRPTNGLWGSKHTRGPIEEIVDSIGKLPKGEDLPLVNLEVHEQGLQMRPHRKNKIKSFVPVRIPIQYISYGLQDTVYPRIFCFIMVKEMSSQTKKLEVHAYACDSARTARNLAAALAQAFQIYSEKLQGGAYKFTVELPLPDEHPDFSEDSCDA